MSEHVFIMVVKGDADRDMLHVLRRDLRHSDLGWWIEGKVVVRPDVCEREGHRWGEYGNKKTCEECDEMEGVEE